VGSDRPFLYIIGHDWIAIGSYDLWLSLLNNDPHSEEQFRAVKEIDGIAREQGVPFTIKRKIGANELNFMMKDDDFSPEEIAFVKKIFQVP